MSEYRISKFPKDVIFLLALLAFLAIFILFFAPPRTFPQETYIEIEKGQSVLAIAELLQEGGYIRSKSALTNIIVSQNKEDSVVAGFYYFDSPISVFEIARRITEGDQKFKPVRITIPEGTSVKQMSEIFDNNLTSFNPEVFIEEALPLEGYLFPDTYFILPVVPEYRIVEQMNDNFKMHIEGLEKEIEEFGKSLEEVIVMASIVEEEVSRFEDRRRVAGVLWRRIEEDMPLQVDAVFQKVPEVNGRNTYELTTEDLKTESAFNTYENTGLPPTPITNPGLDAILATITPIDDGYYFYLSDRDGNTYFSKTFESHKENRIKYLD